MGVRMLAIRHIEARFGRPLRLGAGMLFGIPATDRNALRDFSDQAITHAIPATNVAGGARGGI